MFGGNMSVEVNWLAIVLATVSTMVVGSIWYARSMFGSVWIKLARLDEKKMKSNGIRPIIITVIVSFLSAYILAHFISLAHYFFHNSFLQDALLTSFWAWAGFTAARFITHDAFEARPVRLTIITIGHELVTFLVMGAIIGLMGV